MKDAFKRVESEIRQEKAEALGRAGERLEAAMKELEALRKVVLDIGVAVPGPAAEAPRTSLRLEEMRARYLRLAERVRQLRQHLIIQREAMGLRRHEDVDRQYPLPAPLPAPIPSGQEDPR